MESCWVVIYWGVDLEDRERKEERGWEDGERGGRWGWKMYVACVIDSKNGWFIGFLPEVRSS